MIQLTLLAEGKSELRFAKKPIAECLAQRNVFLHPVAVLTSKDNYRSVQFRGGVIGYSQVKADLLRFAKRDAHKPHAWLTTMIDLYGLPDDFPGIRTAAAIKSPQERVLHLEKCFAIDIGFSRFVPYIQLHEFEALLLAAPASLKHYYGEPRHEPGIARLTNMAAGHSCPELIDDGRDSAPSKRIIAELPEYEKEKATAGPLIANYIGLNVLRQKCPHFHQWLSGLEALGGSTSQVT